jgi:HAD superfamily hydrolase (TIGR01509 family)
MRDITVVLFDLGGVLVEVSSVESLQSLLTAHLDKAEIRKRLVASPLLRQFEVGALEPTDFAKQFVNEWDLHISPADFLVEFRYWSRALLPGAREVLASLRPRYRLAALSNSNQVHWERNTEVLGVTALFDAAFSSHQLGCHKPEPAIYQEALRRLGVSADRVAFFDDFLPNVEGARNEGIAAFHVEGVEELTHSLREHGFILDAAV